MRFSSCFSLLPRSSRSPSSLYRLWIFASTFQLSLSLSLPRSSAPNNEISPPMPVRRCRSSISPLSSCEFYALVCGTVGSRWAKDKRVRKSLGDFLKHGGAAFVFFFWTFIHFSRCLLSFLCLCGTCNSSTPKTHNCPTRILCDTVVRSSSSVHNCSSTTPLYRPLFWFAVEVLNSAGEVVVQLYKDKLLQGEAIFVLKRSSLKYKDVFNRIVYMILNFKWGS